MWSKGSSVPMGDTANWRLEVSIDVHSVQFVEDGHYVLVLTFHDDQLTGSRDLTVSRDGVTFKDGQSLRSDVVKQEQPEETVEIQNNLFVFRLPKGFRADDDYSKLTLHVESYQLVTKTSPTENRGAGDEGNEDQLTRSGQVYQKLGDGSIPIGKLDGDSALTSTNVIPLRRLDCDVEGARTTVGSVKYTAKVQRMQPAIAYKHIAQQCGKVTEREDDPVTPGDDVGSPVDWPLLSPEEGDAAGADGDAAQRNITCNNSAFQRKPASCIPHQGYLSDELPLGYETLPMGVFGLTSTLLTCVLPAFIDCKKKTRPHVTMAGVSPTRRPPSDGITGTVGCLLKSPAKKVVEADNAPSSTCVSPVAAAAAATAAAAAAKELYRQRLREINKCRLSVDMMNIDVSRLQSRISQLETENEAFQLNTVCTCSNKHSKSRDNANADFNEISKEHEMLMSQMKVKVFSPKGSPVLPWTQAENVTAAANEVANTSSLSRLQTLQDIYRQQLDTVKKLRQKQTDRLFTGKICRSLGTESISPIDMMSEVNLQDDKARMKIMAKLDFLMTRITSLEAQLQKNSRTWEKDKEEMAAKLQLVEQDEAKGRDRWVMKPVLPQQHLFSTLREVVNINKVPLGPLKIRCPPPEPPGRRPEVPNPDLSGLGPGPYVAMRPQPPRTRPGPGPSQLRPEPTVMRPRPYKLEPRPLAGQLNSDAAMLPEYVPPKCSFGPAKPKTNMPCHQKNLQTRRSKTIWRF